MIFLDDQLSAIRMISLDRKEAEEFYEVYRDVVAEYAQMVNHLRTVFHSDESVRHILFSIL